MPENNRFNPGIYVLVFICCVGYLALGYFIERHQSLELIGVYTILFAGYIFLTVALKNHISFGVGFGILFRMILIVSLPSLSTDFYRFLWDGHLVNSGINPFAHPPQYYFFEGELSEIKLSLYKKLSYNIYHSMYPPFTQVTGWMGAKLGGDSIIGGAIVLRVLAITADILNILVIQKLLKIYKIPSNRVLLYTLNPFIILELTGNLHHEVYVVLFTLLAAYYLEKKRLISSGIAIGMAVLSKLIPLIFIPLFFKKLGFAKAIKYSLVIGSIILIGFIPFVNQNLITGFISSGSLYFQKLEFNASIYFLVREIGFWVKGYNIIQTAGVWLGILTTVLILLFSLLIRSEKISVVESFMWIWLIFVAFSTTVHPWYIVPIISFSIFTNYRFAIIWSFLIFLTYIGYSKDGYKETYYIFILEYTVVYGYMLYELFQQMKVKGFKLYGTKL